jgi:vacuolar-type H+-ATPase subunit H
METLLDRVKKVEEEVSDRLSEIEKQGKMQLADLISTEKDVVEAVRVKAEAEGNEIIKEQVEKAHAETNALKQDREKSIESIRVNAESGRRDAVEKVVDIFKKTYLK